MRLVNIFRFIILGGTSAFLASCQIGGPSLYSAPTNRPATVQPTGIEGAWIGSDGIGISNFNNGQYSVIASDTGNRLAEGSYTYTSPTLVAVTFTSLLRGTTIQANCQLASQQQLNCTTSSGAQLVLRRHSLAAS